MRSIFVTSITATFLILNGCAGEKPASPSFGKSSADVAIYEGGSGVADIPPDPQRDVFAASDKALVGNTIFELKGTTQDAVEYTYGTAAVAFQNEVTPGAAMERMVYVSDLSKLTADDKRNIAPLCKDINLELGAEPVLSWRSHYSLTLKRTLADLTQRGQTQILCVLRITDSLGVRYLTFDPAPLHPSTVQGTVRGDKAVNLTLMMPIAENINLVQKNLLVVPNDGSIVAGVKALGSDGVTLSLNDDSGTPCWYDSNKSGAVGNPTNLKQNQLNVSTAIPAKVLGFASVATGGRLLKSCSKILLESTADTIQEQFTCQNYQDIKLEGLEAGCKWELEFGNVNDPENTVGVPLQLNKIGFKNIDLNKSDEALSLVPKDPLNPLRTGSATFENFSPSQLKYAELAFDIWLAVYPKSFIEDFKDYMNLVTVSDTCDAGVGGFARLSSTAFTWCSPNLVVAANNPSRPVFHAILIAHETRHSRGWNHDLDDTSYAPCAGSAASAAVMNAIVTSCKADYCATIRNAALNEYITELNYSLRGDARRFLGQCKAWSNAMGLTDTTITGSNFAGGTPQ